MNEIYNVGSRNLQKIRDEISYFNSSTSYPPPITLVQSRTKNQTTTPKSFPPEYVQQLRETFYLLYPDTIARSKLLYLLESEKTDLIEWLDKRVGGINGLESFNRERHLVCRKAIEMEEFEASIKRHLGSLNVDD